MQALTSKDPELRRIAFSSVRSLGERGHALFEQALAKDPDADARRELLVEVAQATSDDGAVGRERGRRCSRAPMRRRRNATRRRAQLKSALDADPTAAATALATLDRQRARADRVAHVRDRGAARPRSAAEGRRGSSTPRMRRSTRSRRACASPRCRCMPRSIPSAPAAISRRCSTTRSSTSRCASPPRSRGARSAPSITAPPRRRSTT